MITICLFLLAIDICLIKAIVCGFRGWRKINETNK